MLSCLRLVWIPVSPAPRGQFGLRSVAVPCGPRGVPIPPAMQPSGRLLPCLVSTVDISFGDLSRMGGMGGDLAPTPYWSSLKHVNTAALYR